MGLDMYLYARKHISGKNLRAANRDIPYEQIPLTPEYEAVAGMFPDNADKYGKYNSAAIQLQVGYWRKANAIHNWFVKNLAEGVDECQEIGVNREDLVKLLDDIEQVLARPGLVQSEDNPVPRTSGFFFGSTEHDQYYIEELQYTKDIIEHVLSFVPEQQSWDNSIDLMYQASW